MRVNRTNKVRKLLFAVLLMIAPLIVVVLVHFKWPLGFYYSLVVGAIWVAVSFYMIRLGLCGLLKTIAKNNNEKKKVARLYVSPMIHFYIILVMFFLSGLFASYVGPGNISMPSIWSVEQQKISNKFKLWSSYNASKNSKNNSNSAVLKPKGEKSWFAVCSCVLLFIALLIGFLRFIVEKIKLRIKRLKAQNIGSDNDGGNFLEKLGMGLVKWLENENPLSTCR